MLTKQKPPSQKAIFGISLFNCNLLRGPELHRRLKVLLLPFFSKRNGLYHLPFPKKMEAPIIVSEPSLTNVRAWLLIAKSPLFASVRAHPFGSRCSKRSSYGFPAVSRVFPRYVTAPGHRILYEPREVLLLHPAGKILYRWIKFSPRIEL